MGGLEEWLPLSSLRLAERPSLTDTETGLQTAQVYFDSFPLLACGFRPACLTS